MKKRGIQPWPWRVEFRQFDGKTGKLSRPRIMDATGKPVSLNNTRQATLAAMSPLLLDRLTKLTHEAQMLHLRIKDALALNVKKPQALLDAEEVLDSLLGV